MPSVSDFYCPLYNQGLYLEKLNQTQTLVSMCCYQKSSDKSYSEVDFVGNDYLLNIRKKYADGKAPSECDACWKLENLNYQSYRRGEILAQEAHQQTKYSTAVLTNLTFNCENICNLKCIICGPRYSSLWKEDYKKLGYPIVSIAESKTKTKHNNIFLQLDFSKLEKIHFQGGEPFLTADHKKILQKACDDGAIGNCVVSYNTNGTVLPDRETIELWKQAKLVKVYFSIDSVGDSFDYVRFPADWKQVENNIVNGFFKISDCNIVFSIGPTVNITNVFYLGDIINWVQDKIEYNLQGDATEIYINPVGQMSYGGKILNLRNFNRPMQQLALEYLDRLPYHKTISPVMNSLSSISPNPENWIEYLNNIDQIRGTNWRESLGHLSQHIV